MDKLKTTEELFEKFRQMKYLNKEFETSNNSIIRKYQGDKVKCVGVAVAVCGKGCQQILWIKTKDFLEDEECE